MVYILNIICADIGFSVSCLFLSVTAISVCLHAVGRSRKPNHPTYRALRTMVLDLALDDQILSSAICHEITENYHGSNTVFLVGMLMSVVGGVFVVFALMALCYRSVVVHRNFSLCLRLVCRYLHVEFLCICPSFFLLLLFDFSYTSSSSFPRLRYSPSLYVIEFFALFCIRFETRYCCMIVYNALHNPTEANDPHFSSYFKNYFIGIKISRFGNKYKSIRRLDQKNYKLHGYDPYDLSFKISPGR